MRKIYNHVRYPSDSRLNFETKKWSQPVHLWRIRKVIHRSGGILRGKFHSPKNGRMIHWQSPLERDAAYLFEFSPGVLRYQEQPFTCWYAIEDQTRRYTVDFEVEFCNGETVYIEVKPAEKFENRELRQKFEAIHRHFSDNGHTFRILTDVEIRQQVLLENLKLLSRYGSARLSPYNRRILCARLKALPALTFEAVAELLKAKSRVWRLLYDRILLCDFRQPITQTTQLTINTEDLGDDELYF